VSALDELCASYGVATRYTDGFRKRRRPPREALVAVLRALGAPVDNVGNAEEALRERRSDQRTRPTVVAWDGRGELRVPGDASCMLELEDGTTRRLNGTSDRDGTRFSLEALPYGIHQAVTGAGTTAVIAAPVKAVAAKRSWGTFAPAYAFTSARSWGMGDFTDLGELASWSASLGASYLGTLPLFACFLEEPFSGGPYSPVSRMYWNEVFVDVERCPEFQGSPEARTAADVSRAEIERLRGDRFVDYAAVGRAKRRVLDALSNALFEEGSSRRDALEDHLREDPELERYAAFRAETERQQREWTLWADSTEPKSDRSDPRWRTHAYAQWVADEQLGAIRAAAGLYLDLPLGVHPGGYDAWRFRQQFASGVSVGAPPDAFFTRGQDWGAPPMRPDRIGDDGYGYVRACVRTLMRHAAVVRIDHMMGFHRVFWVPAGFSAAEGTYVRYPAEALYAIVALESHRAGVPVVGEDLGTVPPEVRPAMARHGIHRSYVVQEEVRDDVDRPLRPAPTAALATINTHDMPTFTSFWTGADIDERIRDGLLESSEGERETKRRAALRDALVGLLRRRGLVDTGIDPDIADVLRATMRLLAEMPPTMFLVPLEELWLEPEPQNVPGTSFERPNWRRKARYSIEQIRDMPGIAELLRDVDARRRKRGRRTA